jgi:hypothetical protein
MYTQHGDLISFLSLLRKESRLRRTLTKKLGTDLIREMLATIEFGREADHSPPTIAEVKKTWIYTSTPPFAFMAQCLIS